MLEEPLDFVVARALIRTILKFGRFQVVRHALEAMDDEGIQEPEIDHTLRFGRVTGCDFERGSWRYRTQTPSLTVVVVFRSDTHLVVVTTWRNR